MATAVILLLAASAPAEQAPISLRNAHGKVIENIVIDGKREQVETRQGLPPAAKTFAEWQKNNGILLDGGSDITIRNVTIKNVAGFAILARGVNGLRIERVTVLDSGSRNDKGRNNTTGGILLEDGTTDFQVTDCRLERIRGNGIWTHSRMEAPRNGGGVIERNRFDTIGRDAIQIGHATRVRVAENEGRRIGFPFDIVDVEGGAIPVGVDTSGNVDLSTYANNRFFEVNGKCFDLDGFHDGAVSDNACRNTAIYPSGHFGIVFNNTNPNMQSRNVRVTGNTIEGMRYGGLFLIGRGHTVKGNHFLRMNLAGCPETHAKYGCYYWADEPDLLSSGIYLGKKAERPDPAAGNVIEDNEITGHGMAQHCIGYAPGIKREENTVRGNRCQ
jgi:hypothetical protein